MRTRGLAGLLLLAGAGPAFGWGTEGHSIVAELAQRRLTPEARAQVEHLLGANASLASVSSWADDVRGARPDSYNWHFVDIPLAAGDYEEARDCKADTAKGDCVVRELQRLKTELRCAASDARKQDALRFAVHFVGDIHQPLHAVGDQIGGNTVALKGTIHGTTCPAGKCDAAGEITNLHALWDSTLIRRTVYDWGAYVDALEEGWLKTEGFQLGMPTENPEDWALQSHAVAGLVWNGTILPDNTVSDDYYARVKPILDQQLALAGVRLARFLNEAYASADCGGAAAVIASPGAARGLGAYANLGDAKLQAAAYAARPENGGPSAYERDQAAVAEAATAYILQRAAQVKNPAVVLDIDETSLDNLKQMLADDWGYIAGGPCLFTPDAREACGALEWDKSGAAPAVAATLKLFKAARQAGVEVFFITGRHEAEREWTVSNLHQAGYEGWKELIMQPDGSLPKGAYRPSAADFKAPARARLVLAGYSVIANLGDQPSDLAGGYAEKAFLMPNPFYRIR